MPKILSEWEFIISPLGNLIPLYLLHYFRYMLEGKWLRRLYYFLLALSCVYMVRFFHSFWLASKIHFYQLTGATLVYAGVLFAILSEMMLAGLKTYLTRKRTDIWAKEMDYLYLMLGGFGIAISTSRLDIVDEKLTMPEFLGPFVLATALVIRALKARVEINGWNKLEEPRST
jgi:hypothetical protein